MLKSLLDDSFDILFHHRQGISRIAAEKNIWHGLFVYLIVSLLVSPAIAMLTPLIKHGVELFPPEVHMFFPPQMLEIAWKIIPLLTVLLQLVFCPLYFMLMVAILSFVSVLFGGRGKISSLGAVLGFAHLPYLIVAIGSLWGRVLTPNIIVFLFIVALGWSVYLRIAGLKEINSFPWGRTALVYVMPLLALLTSFILFLMLAIVFLAPPFMQV